MHFIDYEIKIDTFDSVRVSGYAWEEMFEPTGGEMRDMVARKPWSDSYLKYAFHHLSRVDSI